MEYDKELSDKITKAGQEHLRNALETLYLYDIYFNPSNTNNNKL